MVPVTSMSLLSSLRGVAMMDEVCGCRWRCGAPPDPGPGGLGLVLELRGDDGIEAEPGGGGHVGHENGEALLGFQRGTLGDLGDLRGGDFAVAHELAGRQLDSRAIVAADAATKAERLHGFVESLIVFGSAAVEFDAGDVGRHRDGFW